MKEHKSVQSSKTISVCSSQRISRTPELLVIFIFQIVCSIIIFTLNKKLKDLIPSNLYKYFIDLKCHLFFPRLPLTNIKQELNLTIVTKNLFNLRV